MAEGENAEEKCTVSLRRVLKHMVRQTGKRRQVEGTEKNIIFLPTTVVLEKNLKERIHLNLDEEALHKIKLLILY